jgi:excisionase family DNA binding protein
VPDSITDPADMFSAGEAAQRLRVSVEWLREECRAKRVPHTKIAGRYRFTEAQLQAILAQYAVEVQLPKPSKPERNERKPRKSARVYPRVEANDNDE